MPSPTKIAIKHGILLAVLSLPLSLRRIIQAFITPVPVDQGLPQLRTIAQYNDRMESFRVWFDLERWFRYGDLLLLALIVFLFLRTLHPDFTLLMKSQKAPGRFRDLIDVKFSYSRFTGLLLAVLLCLTVFPIAWGSDRLLPFERVLLGGIPYFCHVVLHRMLSIPTPITRSIAWTLGGAILWASWSPVGLTRGEDTPRDLPKLLSAILRGAAAGVLTGIALLPASSWSTRVLRSLGEQAFGIYRFDIFSLLTAVMLVLTTVGFFVLGMAGYLLAKQSVLPHSRLKCLSLPLCLVLLSALVQTYLYKQVAVNRYDCRRRLDTTVVPHPKANVLPETILIFTGEAENPLLGFTWMRSIVNVEVNKATVQRSRDFLNRRQYRSCLTIPAFMHLHDASSLSWDPVESLRVDKENLSRFPSPEFAELLIERLGECPITAETQSYLDWLADERLWQHTRQTRLLLYRLRYEFGVVKKTRDSHDSSPREASAGSRGWLTKGAVTGRLILNGKPFAGALVGVTDSNHAPYLGGEQRPFQQRHVVCGVRTDRRGGFLIQSLRTGDYQLVLKSLAENLPGDRERITITHAPGSFRLDSHQPRQNLGTIRISVTEPGAQERIL